MPGLADLILAEDDLDDVLQDNDLAAELAKLRAKRDELEEKQAERGGDQNEASGNTMSDVGARAERLQVSATPTAVAGTPQQRARSLADAILSGGAADVDSELQAMDQELEQQLAEFRAQQRIATAEVEAAGGAQKQAAGTARTPKKGDAASDEGQKLGGYPGGGSAAPTQIGAAIASAVKATEVSGVGSSLAATSGLPAGSDDEDFDLKEDQEVAPEIQELRGEAAMMEEAFPDLADGAVSQPAPQPRRWRPRALERDVPREDAPLEPGVLEMKSALDDLDAKLQAIQSRQVDITSSAAAAKVTEPSAEATKAINEMRAQNEHLRKCMEDAKKRGGKGRLNFDRNLFGASQAKPVA